MGIFDSLANGYAAGKLDSQNEARERKAKREAIERERKEKRETERKLAEPSKATRAIGKAVEDMRPLGDLAKKGAKSFDKWFPGPSSKTQKAAPKKKVQSKKKEKEVYPDSWEYF
jgi:hypothetical protein